MSEESSASIYNLEQARRQHPVAAITNFLSTLRELLVPIILVAFFGGGGQEGGLFSSPLYVGGMLGFLLLTGFVKWLRYTYRVEEDELRIEYGVLVRKRSFIPRHRIQVIDISSGVLQRMFGLVSLNVQTAGGSTPGATINALTREEAEWIKETLSRDDEASEAARENGGEPAAAETAAGNESERPEPQPEYRLSWNRLLVAGTTSGSFGIALSIVGTIFAQINTVVDENALVNFLEDFVDSSAVFFAMLLTSLVVLAWVLSIVGTVLSNANFELFKRKKEIIISRGLFEKKQITIPYSRIQAVRIKQGIVRQPLGYCSLYVDSAGFGQESGESTVLFPLLPLRDAQTFLKVMVPEYAREIPVERPPLRALRRYILRSLLPVFALIAASYWLLPIGHWSLLLIPFGVLLGYMRFQAAAAGTDEDTITITYRGLAKTTALVKRYRIQSASGWANWFQRRRGLQSLSINIASSNTGATFNALDLEEETALNFVEWVEPFFVQKQREKDASQTQEREGGASTERSASDFFDTGF
ncbi:MAG: PH domain-containing protein [Cyclonatronaceae bacterium]